VQRENCLLLEQGLASLAVLSPNAGGGRVGYEPRPLPFCFVRMLAAGFVKNPLVTACASS
jgi:hypothetical protein